MNIVVLQGRLSREPEERVLASGDRIVSYDVTVRPSGGRAESVPVVWFDAPPLATDLRTDTEIVVSGRVRRRYFRTEGATQSRTEVVADTVVAKRTRRRVATLVDAVLEEVQQLTPS